ncbi:Gfo/Idh/MocA family protein [Georgenia deserti]|uniref:Gfo/Idh/MocA family protein n=1 Tax=Georgenia deserti TaxID=2093781 RepID=A0ABW4L5G8_9MICO
MRIGIIGAGGIAHHHVAALRRHSDVAITSVVDLDPSAAHDLAARTGADVVGSVTELVDRVDAVYVLTPPSARVSIIEQTLAAGRPVLCEKPLAATVEDGRQIAQLVEAAGVPFMMGFMRRWHQPYRDLHRLVGSGALGRTLQIVRTRGGTVRPAPGNWRIDPDRRCGVTMESLSHDIDLLRWLGGEIATAVGATVESRPDLPGFDDNVAAAVRFTGGGLGTLQLSWTSAVGYNQTAVLGERGAAVVGGEDMWTSTALRSRTGEAAEERTEYPAAIAGDMGYDGETSAFLELVRGAERADAPTVRDGLATLVVAHAILDAADALAPPTDILG